MSHTLVCKTIDFNPVGTSRLVFKNLDSLPSEAAPKMTHAKYEALQKERQEVTDEAIRLSEEAPDRAAKYGFEIKGTEIGTILKMIDTVDPSKGATRVNKLFARQKELNAVLNRPIVFTDLPAHSTSETPVNALDIFDKKLKKLQ